MIVATMSGLLISSGLQPKKTPENDLALTIAKSESSVVNMANTSRKAVDDSF
ncbi:MAG TPA: hypothetical protein VFW52_00400 [Candidatus Saccharimonadales bacterium]|nr:hypothetical protein [Candidatus Saccharimonadales bacterium]